MGALYYLIRSTRSSPTPLAISAASTDIHVLSFRLQSSPAHRSIAIEHVHYY